MNKQRFGYKPVKTFIEFIHAGASPSGKTQIWNVVNTNFNEVIGTVHWSGAWRKYVYETPLGSYYDWECLRLLADFTEEKTLEHRKAKSA